MHSKQQQIEILFHMLKKTNIQKLDMWNEENAVHFLCTPKWRVRGYIVPPNMKVKGYMYYIKHAFHSKAKLSMIYVSAFIFNSNTHIFNIQLVTKSW